MSGVAKKLMSASGGAGGGFTAIEDVFSTYLYTGNGSTQTITNGIDLAGEGGLVWTKGRIVGGGTSNHRLVDTVRGATKSIASNLTNAQSTDSTGLTAFNSDGYTLGSDSDYNYGVGTNPYTSWTFRKAPRFFDVVTYTGTGAARTIDHNLGTTVGSIIIKRTDTTSNWAVYHRGNTAAPETDFLSLNLTNATADDATYWNDTAPTDSVFTVGTNSNVNASGGTYVAYLYAHDPLGPSEDGSDGLISCGSYTLPASGDVFVDLGWEPQWVLFKTSDSSSDWKIVDSMRGFTNNNAVQPALEANNSGAEGDTGFANIFSTGFGRSGFGVAQNYIYIAIRRGPMRVPESGTEVFSEDYFGQNSGGVSPAHRSGWPVDAFLRLYTPGGSNDYPGMFTRLLGNTFLVTSQTLAEQTFNNNMWPYNNGVWDSAGTFSTVYTAMFRRAPNFFDVVAYTGDGVAGRTVPHNLGVAPEMMIVKSRNNTASWVCYHKDIGNTKAIYLNSNSAATTASSGWWNNTSPTESVFTLGANTTQISNNYISYHFATLAGISKVGSYTGNGTTLNIDCGFTTGARFVLIKGSSFTHDWHVFDTARGIVAGNDPFLELNTTNAEDASYDAVDPLSSGFTINQTAVANLNANGASYIFYAIA